MSSITFILQMLTDALLMGMIYAFVAIGLALVWGVADIVNFAYGNYMVGAMIVTVIVSNSYGVDPLLLVPVNAVMLFIAGYLTYKIIVIRVMDAPMLSQILVTFGLLLVLTYGGLMLIGASVLRLDSYALEGQFVVGGVIISISRFATAIVSVASLTLFFFFLRYTKTGKAIRATSQDREAAKVVGIDPDRTLAVTWGIGHATVGIAGTLTAMFIPVQAESTPLTWTLISFAAVALGGFGNVLAAGIGGVVISFVEQFGVRYFNPSFRTIYIFIVFLIALVVRKSDTPTIVRIPAVDELIEDFKR